MTIAVHGAEAVLRISVPVRRGQAMKPPRFGKILRDALTMQKRGPEPELRSGSAACCVGFIHGVTLEM